MNEMSPMQRAALYGAYGFGVSSIIVFATVAFAERWMYTTLGLGGAYAVWTVLFLSLGSWTLGALFDQPALRRRLYWVFPLAFLAYSVAWMAAYFMLRNTLGEWLGALAGPLLLALVLTAGFGSVRLLPRAFAILFVANTLGYFLGSALNNYFQGPYGMLQWGAVYGLLLGAGLGIVLRLCQLGLPLARA